MPQQQYNSRSSVIPFQVPDIAKVAYEQSYGQRQTERKERSGRRDKAQEETEGLVEGISTLPIGWTGTPILQTKLEKVMDLGLQYEQNPDVYDEFRKEKEEFEAMLKQSQGAFTFYNKQNLDATSAPFEFTRNEEAENNFLRGQYTSEDDLRNALLPENVTAAAPREITKPPKYLDPINALDKFAAYTGEGVGVPVPVGTGYKTVYTEQDKQNILNSMRNTFMSDPEFRNSVIFYDKAKNDRNFALGRATDEMIQETMQTYATDEKMQQMAIERYFNALLPSMEAKLPAQQYAPKQKSDNNKSVKTPEKTLSFVKTIQRNPSRNEGELSVYDLSPTQKTIKVNVAGKDYVYTLSDVYIDKNKNINKVVFFSSDPAMKPEIWSAGKAETYIENTFGDWRSNVGGNQTQQETTILPKKGVTPPTDAQGR